MDASQIRAALSTMLEAALCLNKYTYEDLQFIQLCTDPSLKH